MSKEKQSTTGSLHRKFDVEHEQLLDEEQSSEMLEHPSYEMLQKQLTEAEEKSSQYWERILRMQADTENAQRRLERDIANAHKFALEKFALELLPVIDNLERAIAMDAEEKKGSSSLLDGVSLTSKMLSSAMEKFGIESIDPQGEIFNPELHQAVSTQVDNTTKPNTVLQVLQKGYLLNKRLIRPALVIVSKDT